MFAAQEPKASVPFIHALICRCHRIWAAARQRLVHQGDRTKKAADRRRRCAPTYQPGQKVRLSARNLPLKVTSKKLAPRFVRPFPVSKVFSPAAVCLRWPRSHPTFHVSQVKPVKLSLGPTSPAPPPPEMVNVGGPVCKVKRLLAVRIRGRGWHLVDWVEYGPEERQWVPSRFSMDPTLIGDFHCLHPECLGLSGSRSEKGGSVTLQ